MAKRFTPTKSEKPDMARLYVDTVVERFHDQGLFSLLRTGFRAFKTTRDNAFDPISHNLEDIYDRIGIEGAKKASRLISHFYESGEPLKNMIKISSGLSKIAKYEQATFEGRINWLAELVEDVDNHSLSEIASLVDRLGDSAGRLAPILEVIALSRK